MNVPGAPTKTTCPTPRGTSTTNNGEVFFIPCGKLTCPRCGPGLALRTVTAIVLAEPTHAGFVSMPSSKLRSEDDIEQAPKRLRRAMGRTARDLNAAGLEWEHVSVVEASATGRPHLHFLSHGSAVSSKQLRETLAKHGVGWAEIDSIRRLPTLARYVLKVPIGALDLDAEQAVEVLELHKARNGGRLATTTTGFWRAPGCTEINGVRAARAVAYRMWRASRMS